jgi:hypothetical protein
MSGLINNAQPLFTTLEMYTHLILAQTVPALSLHCSAELAAVCVCLQLLHSLLQAAVTSSSSDWHSSDDKQGERSKQ